MSRFQGGLGYKPLPVPYKAEDIPRYLSAELLRIEQAFIQQPAALTVNETGVLTAATTDVWVPLFIGADPLWEVPSGAFDPATGEWTIPQDGLYQLMLQIEVGAFGAGNKTYYVGMRGIIQPPAATSYVLTSYSGGADDVPLTASSNSQTFLTTGTTVNAELAITHSQFTGDVDFSAHMQLLRVSS